MQRQRGIALLMVLWALVLLALIATIFGDNARTEVLLARNLVENAQAEALDEAGLYRAIAGLTKEPREDGFHGDGRIYSWHTSSGEVRFSIRNEGGKIDINQASEILLRELFVVVGVDPKRSADIADAIIDFRDEDSDKRPHGAEKEDYVAAGLSYGPKNKPFELVDELIYVIGMTSDLYRKVAPLVTVHGGMTPHVNTAPAEVSAAMTAVHATPHQTRGGGGTGGSTGGGGGGGRVTDWQPSFSMVGDDASVETPQEQSTVRIFTVHAEGRTHRYRIRARSDC